MALQKVYIETTIPSFYHETRSDVEAVARKNWTQHWWDFKRTRFEIFTSVAVLDELKRSNRPSKEKALALLQQVAVLPIESPVTEIVETYIRRHVMPADPAGDALHLALASFHRCDFLLTWNCSHLANANKFPHIRRVNSILGLYIPTLVLLSNIY